MFKLTKENINKYYKIFSYITIGFGILVLIIPQYEFGKRLLSALAINIVYHVFYYIPRIMELHEGFKRFAIVNVGVIILKIFTIFCFFWAFSLILQIINLSLFNNYYESLFIITLPVSFFLGSCSVWLSLNTKQ